MTTNLVVGSDGFVGAPLGRFLESLGERVVHFDLKRGTHEDARVVQIDFSGIDRVVLLAWKVGGAKCLYRSGPLDAQAT